MTPTLELPDGIKDGERVQEGAHSSTDARALWMLVGVPAEQSAKPWLGQTKLTSDICEGDEDEVGEGATAMIRRLSLEGESSSKATGTTS